MDIAPQELLFKNPVHTNPDWVQSLESFNQIQAGTQTFGHLFDVEKKSTLVASLVKAILESETASVVRASATTLRILCRESLGIESTMDEQFVWHCWKGCGFSKDPSPFDLSTQTEISKALVNILFKAENISAKIAQQQGHLRLAAMLHPEDIDTKFPATYAFPLLRILFLLMRPNDQVENAPQEVADSNGIPNLFRLLRHWTSSRGWPSNPTLLIAIREALQVLFTITVEMGTLAKGPVMTYETYLPNYQEDIGLLLSLLNEPPEPQACAFQNPQLYEMKLGIMNCFMNTPIPFFRVLIVLGEKDKTLKTMFDLLEIETTKEGAAATLYPLFVVLKNLLQSEPAIRPYAFSRMFPGRDLEREAAEDDQDTTKSNLPMDVPDKDKDTIGNRIIRLMTSFNQATQFTSNDLLFALVGEETDLFVRLTGFGNAAGLLAMRKLFGMGQHLEGDTLRDFKDAQTETEAAQKLQAEINKLEDPTSHPDVVKPRERIKIPDFLPEQPDETEEDREHRLVTNFEKMVDAGWVKLVHKDDKEDPDKKDEKDK